MTIVARRSELSSPPARSGGSAAAVQINRRMFCLGNPLEERERPRARGGFKKGVAIDDRTREPSQHSHSQHEREIGELQCNYFFGIDPIMLG